MRAVFAEMTEQHLPIIAITGGDFDHVLERIKRGELPRFAAIAGTVGSDLWILQKSNPLVYKQDLFYQNALRASGYNRSELLSKTKQFIIEIGRKHPEWRIALQEVPY